MKKQSWWVAGATVLPLAALVLTGCDSISGKGGGEPPPISQGSAATQTAPAGGNKGATGAAAKGGPAGADAKGGPATGAAATGADAKGGAAAAGTVQPATAKK